MTVSMDNSRKSSWDFAEGLFKKNIELGNGLRKAAQSRVRPDPNAWLQMRDNYEAVVLQDHDFSEEHEVEAALWNIHYKRIEEFRKHINDGNLVGDLVASQDSRSLVRLERTKKIRSMFKIFLSEATGFYHDLILKVKEKYGLPLVDTLDSQVILVKGATESAEMKKGLMSCHRCLVYLGDLARYKVLYGGEGKSIHDFTVASSYYAQAASLWPSIGSAHHQIGLLASYSGDYLVAIYGYFRSLAVDAPFSKARANSIVAFEKNRQTYSHSPTTAKEQELTVPEIFKALSSGFVRLIDILFTRISLETFGEVSSLVISNMCNLLSSGPMEELNFGRNATENELVLLRIITILIFIVHDINNSVEQSYAEIVQHKVLLQNAFSFLFEFVGHILKRCTELNDVASSYLLPTIMVFMEWLACHPDIATRTDLEEKEATARGYFWKQCISLMNKLMISGFACISGDDDTTCFSDMSLYDGGETDNRLALWEDFELREFTPLKTAQLILDFSRKHSLGNDGRNKEKKARLKRIFASGKALVQAVKVDQEGIYYDSNKKKFVIGAKPSAYDVNQTSPHGKSEIVELSKENLDVTTERLNDLKQTSQDGRSETGQPKEENLEAKRMVEHLLEEEDDDEVILFQPAAAKNYPSSNAKSIAQESIHPVQKQSRLDIFSASLENYKLHHARVSSIYEVPSELALLKLLSKRESLFTNDINIAHTHNELSANPIIQIDWGPQYPFATANCNPCSTLSSQTNITALATQSKFDSALPSKLNSGDLPMKFVAPLPVVSKKNPVNRAAVKQNSGFPPGFGKNPATPQDDAIYKSALNGQHTQLDASKLNSDDLAMKFAAPLPVISKKNPVKRPAVKRHSGFPPDSGNPPAKPQDDAIYKSVVNGQHTQLDDDQTPSTGNSNASNVYVAFPFPGRQTPMLQTETKKNWLDFELPTELKLYSELFERQANQQSPQLQGQYQLQPLWSGHYFV